MAIKRPGTAHGCWAEFRFGVVGHLFSGPPGRGQLGEELKLSAPGAAQLGPPHQRRARPVSRLDHYPLVLRGARHPDNPVAALRPGVRRDRGKHRPHFAEAVWSALFAQYTDHPIWTDQLHADNLHELCLTDAELGPAPSYATVRRHMKGQGWVRRPKRRDDDRPAAVMARGRGGRLGHLGQPRRGHRQLWALGNESLANAAFRAYRNFDGANSAFGELRSTLRR